MRSTTTAGASNMNVRLIVLWILVGIPLLWGVLNTLESAMKLFK